MVAYPFLVKLKLRIFCDYINNFEEKKPYCAQQNLIAAQDFSSEIEPERVMSKRNSNNNNKLSFFYIPFQLIFFLTFIKNIMYFKE
jgi:hypothetical protein